MSKSTDAASKKKDSVEQLLWDKLEFESKKFKTPEAKTAARKVLVKREQEFYAVLEAYDASSLKERGQNFAKECKDLDAKLNECNKAMLGDDIDKQALLQEEVDEQITTTFQTMESLYSKDNTREYNNTDKAAKSDFRKICQSVARANNAWKKGQSEGWNKVRVDTLNRNLNKVIAYEQNREKESGLSFGQSAKLTLIKMAANISVGIKRVLGRGDVSKSYTQEVQQMKVRLTSKSLARSVTSKMIKRHTAKKKLAVLTKNKENIMKVAGGKFVKQENAKAARRGGGGRTR